MPSSRREVLDGREEVGDASAPPGSPGWIKYLRYHTISVKRDVRSLAIQLKDDLTSLQKDERWKVLADENGNTFWSWEDFCQYREPWGLGMRPEQVGAVLAETDPTRTLRQVLSHAEAGRLGGRGKKASDRGNGLSGRGNRNDYIEGRLRKVGRSDLADQVAAGEISAYAAAVAMGWRGKADNSLLAIWKRTDAAGQAAFLDAIGAVLVQ